MLRTKRPKCAEYFGLNWASPQLHKLVFVMSLSILLSGCTEAYEQKQFVSDKVSFLTRAATVEMMLEAWVSDALPDNFASRALPTAAKGLALQAGQLEADMVATNNAAALLRQAMSSMLSAAIAAEASVRQSNRTAADTALQDLRHSIAQFKSADES
jgi:hypothetical protein